MVDFKVNIGDKVTQKTYKVELKDPDSAQLMGKKIGETFRGELLGLSGYEFEITGGSDKAGFPMKKDVDGTGRKKLLLAGRVVGFKPNKKFKGIRKRKTIRGNTIADDIVQINCAVKKAGAQGLDVHFAPKAEEKLAEADQAEQSPAESTKVEAAPATA